jgi:hypothetical protein
VAAAAFVLVVLLQIAIVLWGTAEARRFLDMHKELREPRALVAFKRLAKRNMLGAIAMLTLGAISLVLALLIAREYGSLGLAAALAVYVPCALLGLNLTRLEGQARNLPCENEEMSTEYRRVGSSWRKRILPDF